MITQEVWRDLRALARQGYDFSRIGVLVGLDRRTVKKHLQMAQPPIYQRPPWPSKLDPFRPLIEQWLVRVPGLRATRIYRDMRTHDGVPSSFATVQWLVRTLRPPRPVAAHIRFETAARLQAYGVCERTTRQVSKACRFSFEGSLYSAMAECAGQCIALRVFPDRLGLHTLEPIPRALGTHGRVRRRGSLVEKPTHDAPLRGARVLPLQLPPAAHALELSGPPFTPVAPFDVPVVYRSLAV